MKKIALTGALKEGAPNISINYTLRIERLGHEPVMAYPRPPEMLAAECSALMVCGGGDIDPKYFGQAPLNDTLSIDGALDEYEIKLVRAFIAAGKPMLGICRGMQVINVALGGTLFQDLPSQLGLTHSGQGKTLMHEIRVCASGFLYPMLGRRAVVNSFHHQSVHRLGEGLRLCAAAPDGVLEAFESEDGLIIGVQWHPERMENMQCIFEYFDKLIDR